ncbi:hypothetical protein VTN77DRAFT_1668 [Rasamsonia byssochlamydoides]|uniref:uncharacterized protein n=1 Tax=Rasamsonia byssochlamydoides TaxID=89139 RepID=UPI00374432D2
MAPFGTLYTYVPNARILKTLTYTAGKYKIQAAARLNGLDIQLAPEFRSKFPPGKVSALKCSNGTCVFESDAIVHYVAETGPHSAQLLSETPA